MTFDPVTNDLDLYKVIRSSHRRTDTKIISIPADVEKKKDSNYRPSPNGDKRNGFNKYNFLNIALKKLSNISNDDEMMVMMMN